MAATVGRRPEESEPVLGLIGLARNGPGRWAAQSPDHCPGKKERCRDLGVFAYIAYLSGFRQHGSSCGGNAKPLGRCWFTLVH